MTRDIEPRRRVLLILYHRYLAAERDWQLAQREARSWFPEGPRATVAPIGDPGSRIRRLHDRRDRTVEHLAVALQALHGAKGRRRRVVRTLGLPSY